MRLVRPTRRLCTAASAHVSTLRWVDSMIVGMNLCPYTKAVRNRAEAMRCIVCSAIDDGSLLDDITAEVHTLAAGQGETSLLVVPPTTTWGRALHDDFGQFLSLGWQVEERLSELAPTTLPLQLALFHPLAVRSLYASGAEEDPADYAMRSPHPTIHLLRTADVQALPPASAARVPERNRETLEGLGVAKLRELYAAVRVGRDAETTTTTT